MIRALLLLALAVSCQSTKEVAPLAHARMVSDFGTYQVQRVGLLPPVGAMSDMQRNDVQSACRAEFAASTALEIVRLTDADLDAISELEPHRRGNYSAGPILAMAKRYQLDGLLIPTVTDLQVHPPQRLGLTVDLISTETGQTIWTSSVHADAAQQSTIESVRDWAGGHQGDVSDHTWEVILLSPKRFCRFAAFQLASLL